MTWLGFVGMGLIISGILFLVCDIDNKLNEKVGNLTGQEISTATLNVEGRLACNNKPIESFDVLVLGDIKFKKEK